MAEDENTTGGDEHDAGTETASPSVVAPEQPEPSGSWFECFLPGSLAPRMAVEAATAEEATAKYLAAYGIIRHAKPVSVKPIDGPEHVAEEATDDDADASGES